MNSQPVDTSRDTVTVAFYTLGCKLNQIESESIAGAFNGAGARIRSLAECLAHSPLNERTSERMPFEPAMIVINTCTVTGKAEQKARRIIRRSIRAFPSALIIVTGCFAEMNPEQIAALGADICVVPQSHKYELLDAAKHLVMAAAADRQRVRTAGREILHRHRDRAGVADTVPKPAPGAELFRFSTSSYSFHSRAFLKIQDGCDNRCAYCRVPLARGGSVSRAASDVVGEAKAIAAADFREIVLTGVNISSYSDSGMTLPGLVRAILDASTGFRLRLSSLEPDMIGPSYDTLLRHPRVCPHFHIPVQSGSDAVLAAMKRKYDSRLVRSVVDRLREKRPEAFIAADFITGFPGETQAHHRETVSLVRECGFTRLHVFPFSPRPGTAAVDLPHKVPEREAVLRAGELRDLSEESLSEYRRGFHGGVLEVLLETPGSGDDEWFGVSGNYLKVPVRGVPQLGSRETPKGRLCRCRYVCSDGFATAEFIEWRYRF